MHPEQQQQPSAVAAGMPIAGPADAAAQARRAAGKSSSLEEAAKHNAQLRQLEEDRVQEAQRKMEALRLAVLIQRGD
jgi:hypothetical protein